MDIPNPLKIRSVEHKLQVIEAACHHALLMQPFEVPEVPGRDLQVCGISELPPKRGVGSRRGQARLLHDLASIELQAMEMGFRTLVDHPEAPVEFREQLVRVILDEARHLSLCLRQIQDLGFSWGDWPVHIGLWNSLNNEDSVLDRLFIVHRYLEGSGLDASEKIQKRLVDVAEAQSVAVVRTIAEEELGHVQFGSRWYKRVCQLQGLEPDEDFRRRSQRLYARLPRRLENMNKALRLKAGFSESEFLVLEDLQKKQFLEKQGVVIRTPAVSASHPL